MKTHKVIAGGFLVIEFEPQPVHVRTVVSRIDALILQAPRAQMQSLRVIVLDEQGAWHEVFHNGASSAGMRRLGEVETGYILSRVCSALLRRKSQ